MPLARITLTEFDKEKSKDLSSKISSEISSLTGKPINYVMTIVQSDAVLNFAGSLEPSCFIEIKSIGSLDPKIISRSITSLIENELKITSERIYIHFEDVKASMWGFDGSTFG
tara:strand:- start:453 stop:791 length:339 start_codon:yes stop_codon:yes gene_type:complete